MAEVAILDSQGLVVKKWHVNQIPDRECLRQAVQEVIDRDKELKDCEVMAAWKSKYDEFKKEKELEDARK